MNRIHPQTIHLTHEYLNALPPLEEPEPIEVIEEPKNPIIEQLEQEVEALKGQIETLKMQLENSRQEVMRLQLILHQGSFVTIGAYE